MFLKILQYSQETTAPESLFNKVAGQLFKNKVGYCFWNKCTWAFVKRETPAQVFSSEFCEIFNFYKTPLLKFETKIVQFEATSFSLQF